MFCVDPIDVPKDENNLRKSDLIQTILSIYGSKTLFMEEYRALLADRLLRLPKPRPITHEIKCLELLKLRLIGTLYFLPFQFSDFYFIVIMYSVLCMFIGLEKLIYKNAK